MYVLIFAAAGSSILLADALAPNSVAVDLLHAVWLLAPYLVLTGVTALSDKRVSLLATAVVTLLGAVGSLTSVVVMTLFEDSSDVRLVPLYQAGAIALLLPTCKWIIPRIEMKPPPR